MGDQFRLSGADKPIVSTAITLLEKVIRSSTLSQHKLTKVKLLLAALRALPAHSPDVEVDLTVSSPWHHHNGSKTQFYWQITAAPSWLMISSGGYHVTSGGMGDSLTAMQWEASTNGPAARPSTPVTVTPVGSAESAIAKRVDLKQVESMAPDYWLGATRCDVCRKDLSRSGLLVDGLITGSPVFACFCIPCFQSRGVGIGWSKGPLYARQADDSWRLVDGFEPKR